MYTKWNVPLQFILCCSPRVFKAGSCMVISWALTWRLWRQRTMSTTKRKGKERERLRARNRLSFHFVENMTIILQSRLKSEASSFRISWANPQVYYPFGVYFVLCSCCVQRKETTRQFPEDVCCLTNSYGKSFSLWLVRNVTSQNLKRKWKR